MHKKSVEKLQKIKKIAKNAKKNEKGYLQIAFYMINYGKNVYTQTNGAEDDEYKVGLLRNIYRKTSAQPTR